MHLIGTRIWSKILFTDRIANSLIHIKRSEMKKYKKVRLLGTSIMASLLVSIFLGCELQENFEYTESQSTGELDITAWEYIQNHDSLALLEEAIILTDLQSYYQEDVTRTFIAPSNSAFKQYLADNNYGSMDEIPKPILRNAIRYSIVNAKVSFNDPALSESNNPISYETENGQVMYLSHDSNFRGLINEGTNKQWLITTSNLEPTNGVLHIVPSVVYFSAPTGDTNVPDPTIKTDTIYAIHDSFINGGAQKDANFGSDVLLKVKNVDGEGDYDRKSYLMFDTKDFDEEGVITDVTLHLAVKFTHAKGLSLDLYSVPDTTWNEMGITWNNAPAPVPEPVASLITTKITSFTYNIADHLATLDRPSKVSFMIDGEAGGNETDEFASKENPDLPAPMLIAKFASGNNSLEIVTNEGLTVNSGDAFAFSKAVLEITGASADDIIYTLEEIPEHGWLVKGASVLQVGDRFTQTDIDFMNLLYINNGEGTSDKLGLSARDRAGSTVDPFEVQITIQ